jgi:hypothetical protein
VKKLLKFLKLISIDESYSNFNISPNLGIKIKKLPHRNLTDQRLYKPPQCITPPHGGLSNNILEKFQHDRLNKQTISLKR